MMRTIFVMIMISFLIRIFPQDYQTLVIYPDSNNIKLEKENILFPQTQGLKTSLIINSYLRNSLYAYFSIDEKCELSKALLLAKQSGLTELSFFSFNTDSLISFIVSYSIVLKESETSWEDYFCFSKRTGKLLHLSDLSENMKINRFLRLILEEKSIFNHYLLNDLNRNVNKGQLTKKQLEIIVNRIKNMRYNSNSQFAVNDNKVILKKYCCIPSHLKKFVPDRFQIPMFKIILLQNDQNYFNIKTN